MATTPTTLQTIITGVRQRTNMENNQFVTDAELTTEINKSLCQLDMMLVSRFDDYKITPSAALTPDASGRLALPTDFLKLRGVDVVVTAGDPDGYLPLKRFSFRQRIRKPYLLGTATGYGPAIVEYRLQGAYLQLEPIAIATAWTYRVWYTPDYVPLVLATDTLQSYMDSQSWYEYAVVDCSIKVLAKQDLDPATFVQQKAELAELITRVSTPHRDNGDPAFVVDTRYDNSNGGGWGYGW